MWFPSPYAYFRRYAAVTALVLLYGLVAGYLLAEHTVVAGWGDPIEYMEGAENIRQYDSPYHPPLYPLVIASMRVLTGDVFLAGKLVSLLAGMLVVLLTWALGRACFADSKVALLAAALVTLSPVMVRFGYVVSSEMLGAALFLGCTYALALSSRISSRWLVLAGVIGGLAFMTKSVYLVLLPAAVLFILMALPMPFKRRLVQALYFAAAFVVMAAPWSIISLVRHGNLHNLNYANLAFAVLDTSSSWLWFDSYAEKYPSLLALLTDHPLLIVRHIVKSAVNFPLEIVIKQGYAAGVLALLGALALLTRPTLERTAVVFTGGGLLLMTLLAWLNPRFFVPVMPLIMLFAAFFVITRLNRPLSDYWPADASLAKAFEKIPLRRIAVALVLAVALAASVTRVPADFARANVDDELRVGLFLAQNTPEGTSLLCTSKNLAWYAARPFVTMNVLGDISPENLEQAVFDAGAEVVVYTKRHSVYTHPQLEFLLNPGDSLIPPSFRLLYHSQGEWPVAAYWVEK